MQSSRSTLLKPIIKNKNKRKHKHFFSFLNLFLFGLLVVAGVVVGCGGCGGVGGGAGAWWFYIAIVPITAII